MEINFLQVAFQTSHVLQYLFSYAHLYLLGTSIAILLIFMALKKIFAEYVFKFFITLCNGTEGKADEFILLAFKRPLTHLISSFGIYLALINYLPDTYELLLKKVFSSVVIMFIAIGVYRLIGLYAGNEQALGRLLNLKIDRILIPFFSKMLRFIVVALAFVVIASGWGYDVNGFVAGLGLGGLAFALAAKDLLANIFSGIVIIADKPFSIGDWIKTDDVEGTVEDINFRSTKIRTFEHAMVTVPNSNLVNAPIINYTKREMRRITFNLRLRYDTSSEKLKHCLSSIESMLKNHPGVDKNTIFVKFDSLGESSLTLFLYFFTNGIVWGEYLDIKQDINFKIMDILAEAGVKVAFPGSSLYIEPSDR